MTTTARRLALALLLAATVPLAAGCNIIGAAAQLAPAPIAPAQYAGLAGHSAAVMVWADPSLKYDFPDLRLDLANLIQQNLEAAAQVAESKEGKDLPTVYGATFPREPAGLVRYQDDYPETQTMPATDLAPAFHVDRLIYVELDDFSTRSYEAPDLYRGAASATLRVIEVDAGGRTTVGYEEPGIAVAFPDNVPPEGTPSGNDRIFYAGTLRDLASQVARRFVDYSDEERR